MIETNSTWTKRERSIIFSLKNSKPELTSQQVADILVEKGYPQRTQGSIRGIWRRMKEAENMPTINDDDEDLIIDAPITGGKKKTVDLDKEAKEFFEKLKKMKSDVMKSTDLLYGSVGHPKKGANIKVLALSDLHAPLHNSDVLAHAIKHHRDADILVINGDFLDLYSVSQWAKNKSIPLVEEYKTGMKILRELAAIFPKIYLTEGNHEDRLQRYFSSRVDLNVSFMTDSDILYRLSKGYDFDASGDLVKMHDLSNVHYNRGQHPWYVQIGRCIFAHPTGSSGVPMRTAIKTAEWFISRDIPFEAIVVGHTHQMGSVIWNHKLLIEQGCNCIPMEYEATSKMNYRPQTTGYAVMMMDKEGHVDFETSKTVYFGTGSAIEPDSCLIDLGAR